LPGIHGNTGKRAVEKTVENVKIKPYMRLYIRVYIRKRGLCGIRSAFLKHIREKCRKIYISSCGKEALLVI